MQHKQLTDEEIAELLSELSNDENEQTSCSKNQRKIFNANGDRKLEDTMICHDIKRPDFATSSQLNYLATLINEKFIDLRIKLHNYRNWNTKINLPKHPIAALSKEEFLRSVNPQQFCYELFFQNTNGAKTNIGFLSFSKQILFNAIFDKDFSNDKLEKIIQPDPIDLEIMNQTLVNPIIDCINNVIQEKLGNDSRDKIESFNFIPESNMARHFIDAMSLQGAQLDFDVTFGKVEKANISIYLFSSLVKKLVSQYISSETPSSKEDEYSNPENAIVSFGTFKWKNGINVKKGNILELTKLCSEEVDIVVNGKCVAKGETGIVSDHFCVVVK